MYRLPPVFRVVLGVAAVALVALLAYLLFGSLSTPLAAPAAASLTPPRPSVNPTAVPVTSTIAFTATAPPTAKPTATSAAAATPVPTSTLPVTRDWKIYENREQGFRIRYPQQFAYSIHPPPLGPEILHDMIFYDGSKYRLPLTGEVPFIGLHVLTNPQRLSAADWAKAHLFSSPGSNQYSIQFQSYQIVRTFTVTGNQAARLTTLSGEGVTSYVLLIPLPNESRMIYIYYHIDPPTIEPLFEVMALTLERTH